MVVYCFSTKWVIIPKMCCVWLNDFILPKRVGVGKTLLYFGKLVVLGVKWVVFVQYMRCICLNHLYLAKWVVFGLNGFIWANWLCLDNIVVCRLNWLCLGKMIVFGQNGQNAFSNAK